MRFHYSLVLATFLTLSTSHIDQTIAAPPPPVGADVFPCPPEESGAQVTCAYSFSESVWYMFHPALKRWRKSPTLRSVPESTGLQGDNQSGGDYSFDEPQSSSPEDLKATGNCQADLNRIAQEGAKHTNSTSIRHNCLNQEIMYNNAIRVIDAECPNTPEFQNMRANFLRELETARRCVATTTQ